MHISLLGCENRMDILHCWGARRDYSYYTVLGCEDRLFILHCVGGVGIDCSYYTVLAL